MTLETVCVEMPAALATCFMVARLLVSLILRFMVLYCYRSRYRSQSILARFIRFVNVLQELLSSLERFDPDTDRHNDAYVIKIS